MKSLRWDPTLELGHEAMDADHRQLAALVNKLAKGIVDHLGKEAYDAVLDDLIAHTRAHFHEQATAGNFEAAGVRQVSAKQGAAGGGEPEGQGKSDID